MASKTPTKTTKSASKSPAEASTKAAKAAIDKAAKEASAARTADAARDNAPVDETAPKGGDGSALAKESPTGQRGATDGGGANVAKQDHEVPSVKELANNAANEDLVSELLWNVQMGEGTALPGFICDPSALWSASGRGTKGSPARPLLTEKPDEVAGTGTASRVKAGAFKTVCSSSSVVGLGGAGRVAASSAVIRMSVPRSRRRYSG